MTEQQLVAFVQSSTSENITTIEFFHPQSNSLPGKILEEIAEEIHTASGLTDSNIIILKSAGNKTFCAGASFDELLQITNEAEGLKFFSGFAKVINAIRVSPKLVIARIQGKCVGGGVGLAAAADYAIALDTAEIKLSELAVGIGPFVVGPAVERKMGKSAFSALAIDATGWRNANWAMNNGLFAEVYATIEEVDAAVLKLAKTLSLSSPDAMKELKNIFWEGTENWNQLLIERAGISGKLILSDYSRNAIEKFKGK
jgi:methylglutaconyl-CoA hydratase